MKETDRIAKLFEDLYAGSPWIDVTITANLNKLNAQQAEKRIYKDWNTVWEIVNHMISWREAVLQRIEGKILKSPDNNFIEPIQDTSPKAWEETLSRLEASQHAWISYLKNFNEADFEKVYPSNEMTYYEHIHGILQHDAYHLGQIVIMIKQL